MAGNRTTFTKRQKEHARMQKRQDKAERKRQRALDKQNQGSGPEFGTNEPFEGDGQEDHPNSAAAPAHIQSMEDPQ